MASLCQYKALRIYFLPQVTKKNRRGETTQMYLVLPLPQTPPRRKMSLPAVDEISLNPFGERELASETCYIIVSNPSLPQKAANSDAMKEVRMVLVTVLPRDKANVVYIFTTRKKTKRWESHDHYIAWIVLNQGCLVGIGAFILKFGITPICSDDSNRTCFDGVVA